MASMTEETLYLILHDVQSTYLYYYIRLRNMPVVEGCITKVCQVGTISRICHLIF